MAKAALATACVSLAGRFGFVKSLRAVDAADHWVSQEEAFSSGFCSPYRCMNTSLLGERDIGHPEIAGRCGASTPRHPGIAIIIHAGKAYASKPTHTQAHGPATQSATAADQRTPTSKRTPTHTPALVVVVLDCEVVELRVVALERAAAGVDVLAVEHL